MIDLSTLTVNEYQVAGGGPRDVRNVTLRRMPQRTGPDLWAMYDGGSVLDKDGDFVYEPLPSSRDEAYFAQHRFGSAQEALTFFANLKEEQIR